MVSGGVSRTGGAMIGWMRASWPFARLEASADYITLSIGFLGTYRFSPDEVAAIEPQGDSRFFSGALHIIHTNPEFPKSITFSCGGSAFALLDEIRALGFRPRARRDQVPVRNGPAFRWSFLIGVIAIWNALFLLDGAWNLDGKPGVGTLAALGVMFVLSSSLGYSTWLQGLALKPGRNVSESGAFLRLMQLLSGLLILGFLFGSRR